MGRTFPSWSLAPSILRVDVVRLVLGGGGRQHGRPLADGVARALLLQLDSEEHGHADGDHLHSERPGSARGAGARAWGGGGWASWVGGRRTATMATTMMPALPPPSSGGGGGATTGRAQPLKVYGPEVLHTAAAAVPW